jgi:hypothetical protein
MNLESSAIDHPAKQLDQTDAKAPGAIRRKTAIKKWKLNRHQRERP